MLYLTIPMPKALKGLILLFPPAESSLWQLFFLCFIIKDFKLIISRFCGNPRAGCVFYMLVQREESASRDPFTFFSCLEGGLQHPSCLVGQALAKWSHLNKNQPEANKIKSVPHSHRPHVKGSVITRGDCHVCCCGELERRVPSWVEGGIQV